MIIYFDNIFCIYRISIDANNTTLKLQGVYSHDIAMLGPKSRMIHLRSQLHRHQDPSKGEHQQGKAQHLTK